MRSRPRGLLRSVVELAITTGLRSGEIRALLWDSIDLAGKGLFVEHQATRRRDDDTTKTDGSLRTVPVPGYLKPELQRWMLACPLTAHGPGNNRETEGSVKPEETELSPCFNWLPGLKSNSHGSH